MRIVIIGSGNVAHHLIKAFNETQAIIFVHTRNQAKLDLLKLEFPDITSLTSTDLSTIQADLVLICVKDDVLNEVFASYTYNLKTLVAHTSGTQVIERTHHHQNVGVFYPLQTFSKSNTVQWNTVPVLIEAGSEQSVQVLENVAATIQAPYFETNEMQRKAIHVAAVFTSNFVNHLIGKAAEYLQTQSIDYHILQPLIAETIRKAFANNPFDVQTGPAARNDNSTIEKHVTLLQSDVLLQKIYSDITESIQKTSNLGSNKD